MNFALTLPHSPASSGDRTNDSQGHTLQLVRSAMSARLGVPVNLIASYASENQEIGLPPMSLAEQNEILTFYRRNKGYQFAWGQLIEERTDAALFFHFIPTGLIEAGAQIKALNYLARDWYQAFEPVLQGMISLVEGPDFFPFSIRCEHELAREWLAEIFLKTFWKSLMDTWSTKLHISVDQALCIDPADATPERPVEMLSVVLIYRPSYKLNGDLNVNSVHAIFVSVEESPRMCFTSFNTQHGLVSTGWIPLPAAQDEFETQPVDFIIDFHKDAGAIAFELRIPSDLRTVPELVQKLLNAARVSVKEEDIRKALEPITSKFH